MSEMVERVEKAIHTLRHSTPESQARAAIAALTEDDLQNLLNEIAVQQIRSGTDPTSKAIQEMADRVGYDIENGRWKP